MARRRPDRDDEDGGLVEMVLDLSWDRPVRGLVASGVLLLIATIAFFLPFDAPLRPVAQIFAAMMGMLAIFGLAVGVAALLRDRFGLGITAPPIGVPDLRSIRAMHWRAFERFVADVYRRQGYRVQEVGGSGDGGVDLIATRPGGEVEHLIQCKRWKSWDVGEPKVREFYGAMAAHRTRCEGIIVTSGRFTEPARAFAEGKPLRLVDGEALMRMANATNPTAPAVATYTAAPAAAAPAAAQTVAPEVPPPCPKCGAAMIVKHARRGPRAGKSFWGCPRYPRCDGLINR